MIDSASLHSLTESVENLEKARVLCVGDIMLDRFVYGTVDRISPEAPIPVVSIETEKEMLGGAGNVVANLSSLGAHACLVGVIGDDNAGYTLTGIVGESEKAEAYLQKDKHRKTTIKTRHIAGNQQLLRTDYESKHPITKETEDAVFSLVKSNIKDVDVVVLSDYGKGLLTESLIKSVIEEAKRHNKPVIVDPKRRDFTVYKGATIISPNIKELSEAVGRDITTLDDIAAVSKELIEQADLEALLVTRGKDGMALVMKDGTTHKVAAQAREVFDVSGAGDTAVATLAASIATGLSFELAMQLSNLAASIAVSRLGTATVYRTDLKQRLLRDDLSDSTRKIMPLKTAVDEIEQHRLRGRTIGFTNGCFDLIHPGHLSLLEQAKAACDVLVLGLNSDDSVKRLKGEHRPVQHEMARAAVLAAQSAVDYVILFREDTPLKLIEALKPDVLVKGADYKESEVVGGDIVKSYGGKIVLAELTEGQSTSTLVDRITAGAN